MGQKVNPIGLRIGIIREWDAKWYAPKTKVADPVSYTHLTLPTKSKV